MVRDAIKQRSFILDKQSQRHTPYNNYYLYSAHLRAPLRLKKCYLILQKLG